MGGGNDIGMGLMPGNAALQHERARLYSINAIASHLRDWRSLHFSHAKRDDLPAIRMSRARRLQSDRYPAAIAARVRRPPHSSEAGLSLTHLPRVSVNFTNFSWVPRCLMRE